MSDPSIGFDRARCRRLPAAMLVSCLDAGKPLSEKVFSDETARSLRPISWRLSIVGGEV